MLWAILMLERVSVTSGANRHFVASVLVRGAGFCHKSGTYRGVGFVKCQRSSFPQLNTHWGCLLKAGSLDGWFLRYGMNFLASKAARLGRSA